MDKNSLKAKSLAEKIAFAHARDDVFAATPFCGQIGMKVAQFSRIVMGDENITVLTATRIAEGFGVHISRLYQKPRPRKIRETAGMTT